MEGPYVKTIAFGRRESLVPPDASIRHVLALPVPGIKHQVSWPPPTGPWQNRDEPGLQRVKLQEFCKMTMGHDIS
jgi:hypothetical protein